MERPLSGYNHNLRYRNRVYHVQTEDSGVDSPHVDTHLFFRGTIVSTARLDTRQLHTEPDYCPRLALLMQEQHKEMMKRLLRGELDGRIVALLGTLEGSDEEGGQTSHEVRSYRHQLTHGGRVYSVQTDYGAQAVTEIFHHNVRIASECTDCSGMAKPGSEVVRRIAQEQHKRVIEQLGSGGYDKSIIRLLGSAKAELRRLGSKVPLLVERYQHSLIRGGLRCDVVTELYGFDHPSITSRVLRDGQEATSEVFDYSHLLGKPDATELAHQLAKDQHKQLLKKLSLGALDHLIGQRRAQAPANVTGPQLAALDPRASGEFILDVSRALREREEALKEGEAPDEQERPPAAKRRGV